MEIIGEDVVKSPNDTKLYRVIRLRNGLTALLISDGSSSSDDGLAAAGLCVGIGSFSEPDNVPGLAHFLEHMVFMGSQKYPEENHFDKYLKEHGGCTNARTDLEMTFYFFDIQSAYFKPALDRFVQFFINPLLNKDSMERELKLVHAEWAMSVHIEKVRFEQLLGSLAKQGHPMGKFSWGNSDSLQKIPKRYGIEVHQALSDFRRKYYLAQYMTLAIVSKESLDDLQSWVAELFAAIPFSAEPKPDFSHFGPPFDTPSFRKFYKIIPVKNIQQLKLTWALQSLQEHYRKKPLGYLGSLVGHEGEGSLLSLLRKRNWARSIHSGNAETGQEHNSTWACFNVSVTLTETGLKNVIEVITVIFQYLKMLQKEGPQQRIWQEQHSIEENEFKFLEPQDPQEYVRLLSIDMQKYRPCDYITGSRMVMEFDAQLIKTCLESLQPGQMNIAVWSKSFLNDPGANCLQEPWFKTSYYVQDIQEEWIQKWTNCGTTPELFLPKENIYIAKNFELKEPDCPFENLECPISNSTVSRLWYRKDTDFNVPKAYINFYLKSVETSRSATSFCLTDLYVVFLKHIVNEVGYPADVARLSCRIQVYDGGITIHLGGFNDKLPQLFQTVVDCMANFEMSEELFCTIHRELADFYHNSSLCPERLDKELRKSLLQSKCCTVLQKKECLANVNKQLLTDFVKRFYMGVFVEGLIQGNMMANEAVELEHYLLTRLNITPAEDLEALHEIRITKLPDGCSEYAIMNQNENDENSVITNYYQYGESDLHTQLLNELLLMNMEEPCFAQLRTKMQLGYNIQTNHRNIFGILGFSVTVCSQASRFTMEHLDNNIETFLQNYNKDCIQNMTTESFEKFVSSVIRQKRYDDTNLREEVKRHWMEILQQTYLFNRQKEEIRELQNVTLDELKSWSQDLLCPNTGRRKLTVQVTGHSRAEATANGKQSVARRQRTATSNINLPYQQITSIDEFKLKCESYTINTHQ